MFIPSVGEKKEVKQMDVNKDPKESASAADEDQHQEKERRPVSTSSGLLESAVDKFAREGGFDDLPLKGKPIKIEDGDVLTGIMKNANYQPAWIELRKEIAADIKRLLGRPEPNAIPEAELEAINQKIMKYNRMVPNPQLQKGLLSGMNLQAAYDKWE
ncbi:DnaJ-like, subfamily C, member 28, conserved domain protein [Paenibacillus vortex V453]|uniref:DnaJ-like, subfamily C, member 28, conserved domain protein n=2 Tax=Paenibacillus TaxID=44249 RepID=A0A2R9SP32_9BACL|nr:DnaJ-like, subfamily C, member 28, conserved domain protein [Paenibacillus vortex V453]